MRAEYERAISEGELQVSAISAALDMSQDQVYRHMKHHLQPLVQESAAIQLAKKEVDEIDVLSSNIQRLEGKIDELFADDSVSREYIDSLTKLAKEIRESLKYLMEFKGKLVHKRQDTIIVAQMQIVQEVLAQQHPQVWLDVKAKMEERLQ
jgi:DNA-binding transcriptional ArsR family regulator